MQFYGAKLFTLYDFFIKFGDAHQIVIALEEGLRLKV